MDCARTALRHYSKEVNVYARNDFKNNLHLTKELEALLKEGGNTHNHHSLLKVENNLSYFTQFKITSTRFINICNRPIP